MPQSLSDSSWPGHATQAVNPEQDSGFQALIQAARQLDIAVDPAQLWHQHGQTDHYFSSLDILNCAQRLGLKARQVHIRPEQLGSLPTPFLVCQSNQFAWVTEQNDQAIKLIEPISGQAIWLERELFCQQYSSEIILLANKPQPMPSETRFGFSWFLPAIVKHASRFRWVLVASLFIQLFALATPKLFEVVIDKVLVSRGLLSLDILAIGLLGIALFDPLMQFLRATLFAHLASCVNSELSARLFAHLAQLPVGFFAQRQTGDIIARVKELDNIRNFLTGSALMLLIDLLFVSVFLAFMFSYAAPLAWIVLASLLIFSLVWLTVGPFLRKRITHQYECHANNTAFLTETVTGIETIKALGADARFIRQWQDKLALSLNASLKASLMGQWAGGVIGLIQKLSMAIILWFGVQMVMEGTLSVGQLVAFNMLAGHVTMPILRLAQIWQDFQHTGISLRRIGDILDTPAENSVSAGRSSLDKISGEVELRKVTFRYSHDGPDVLKRLDIHIKPGEVMGITGLSGSGKSTLTKLIQRLYVPQSGQVMIDKVDLAMADPAMLRRRIGVVLQESFLFNGTIRENILLANPSASPQALTEALTLSGVDQFIQSLPEGLDSPVGERGNALSGGQRQRIAIARALLSDPKILIFDEATSALDYETEAAILRQLPQIVKGRTVIIIAHRLNTMPLCDRLLVLDKGEILEQGNHQQLLDAEGQYHKLWQLQNKVSL